GRNAEETATPAHAILVAWMNREPILGNSGRRRATPGRGWTATWACEGAFVGLVARRGSIPYRDEGPGKTRSPDQAMAGLPPGPGAVGGGCRRLVPRRC